MMFDPDSISQDHINDLQRAAELAWGEDTRHPSFQGHPDMSQGQCYVTSRWLQKRLGGFVGEKKGHYFWVSPDKQYIIDLTGDDYSRPPHDYSLEGQLDEHGQPLVLEPHHKRWMVGPSVYTRSNHPAYRDFRIVDDTDHERADAFGNRADAYMRGGIPKQADLLGPTAWPGSTPQAQEDWENEAPMIHDEVEPTSMSDESQEYKFVIANGQLHVSPIHEHEDLLNHAGTTGQTTGPVAVGYVQVLDGHATWFVTSNMAISGVHKLVEDFTNNMGWDFDGLLNSNGDPIDDQFGAKKSMWYKTREDGHLIMSHKPIKSGRRIDIIGKTAHMVSEVGSARSALQEWAQDFGYKIAEYPGGGNMLDKMKNMPYLDQHNLGDQDAEPDAELGDISQANDLKCETCGKHFNDINELILHDKTEHHPDEQQVPQNNFPWPQDSDAPLGFGTFPYPSQSYEGLEGAQ